MSDLLHILRRDADAQKVIKVELDCDWRTVQGCGMSQYFCSMACHSKWEALECYRNTGITDHDDDLLSL